MDGHDKYEQILKAKMDFNVKEFCSSLPKALTRFFNYLTNLENGAPIDYERIEMWLKEAAEEEGFKLLDPPFHLFHWILESKRGTDDKSYFHGESKHCLSVNSDFDNGNETLDMQFK